MSPYESLRQAVLEGDELKLLDLCQKLLCDGRSAMDILQKGLIPAMDRLGDLLNTGESYIPQVLLSAKAMQSAVYLLEPLMLKDGQKLPTRGKAVIGTVRGDIHTIGKTLVGIMLQSIGYDVVDLGCNVSAERFIAAIREEHAQVLALSALLTTSMNSMRSIVKRVKAEDFGYPVPIIIGGGPITRKFARELGVLFGATMTDTTRIALDILSGDNKTN